MNTENYIKIINKGFISNELELEQISIIERKLRLEGKNNPEYNDERKKLRQIIAVYENENWNSNTPISDEKIKENEVAVFIAEKESAFILKRKEVVKLRLKEWGMNQKELGEILGHSKTYISELINGLSPFVLKDLIIIHKLLDIKLELLIPTIIPQKEKIRIKSTILKLNRPKLNIEIDELEFA